MAAASQTKTACLAVDVIVKLQAHARAPDQLLQVVHREVSPADDEDRLTFLSLKTARRTARAHC